MALSINYEDIDPVIRELVRTVSSCEGHIKYTPRPMGARFTEIRRDGRTAYFETVI